MNFLLVTPLEAYEKLVNNFVMPLAILKPPIPNHTDLHCMSFEKAALLPITDEDQPSLQCRRKERALAPRGGVSPSDCEHA
jgi:hypothetical protein